MALPRFCMAFAAVYAAALLVGGCNNRRVTAPPLPAPAHAATRANLSQVHLSLREFTVVGRGKEDSAAAVERLQDRFLDYLERSARFRDVAYNLSGRRQAGSPALELAVAIELVQRTRRTFVLDALSVPMLGMWPLVPAWGEAEVRVSVTVAPVGGSPAVTLREQVSAPFTALFYGWYRPAPAEEAFARATGEAFARIAAAIPPAASAALLMESEEPGDGTTEEIAPRFAAAETLEVADAGAGPWASPMTTLPGEGLRIVETRPPAAGGLVPTLLDTLGGVEVAGLWGLARVSSTARLASGAKQEVASGTARQTGYRISLYTAPQQTGAFIYPAVGYVSQKIDNVDARSQLSHLNLLQPEQGDIPAVATDPETGGAIDAGAANVYHLDMQSAYGGLRVGGNLVAGTPSVELFASFAAGVNFLEYRTIRSILEACGADQPRSACRTRHRGWDFLQSGAVGATVGVRLPRMHTALRLIFDYELYRRFKYDHPLEVRGPAVYDSVNGLFQHEMLSMRGASLASASFQLALAGVF